MNVADFARSITFQAIPPEMDVTARPEWTTLSDLQRLHQEVDNTVLPEGGDVLRARLAQVLGIPRMSTFAMGALINHAVADLPEGQAYVNVGVWHGFTLLAGMAGHPAKRCVGVDDFSQFGAPRDRAQHAPHVLERHHAVALRCRVSREEAARSASTVQKPTALPPGPLRASPSRARAGGRHATSPLAP
jgi:hypothetical protein